MTSEEPVDYPLFIRPAAEAVAKGECDRGIVFGGSGNGEAMAANKVRGVRCALCWNEETARLSRQHNDANVLDRGTHDPGRDRACYCAGLVDDGFRRRSARETHRAVGTVIQRQRSTATAAMKIALTNALL